MSSSSSAAKGKRGMVPQDHGDAMIKLVCAEGDGSPREFAMSCKVLKAKSSYCRQLIENGANVVDRSHVIQFEESADLVENLYHYAYENLQQMSFLNTDTAKITIEIDARVQPRKIEEIDRKKLLDKITKSVCKSKYSLAFRDSFEKGRSRREADKYAQLIPNEIHLGHIKLKLSQGKYITYDDMAYDVNLLYHNAVKFYGENSKIVENAKKLRMEIIKEFPPRRLTHKTSEKRAPRDPKVIDDLIRLYIAANEYGFTGLPDLAISHMIHVHQQEGKLLTPRQCYDIWLWGAESEANTKLQLYALKSFVYQLVEAGQEVSSTNVMSGILQFSPAFLTVVLECVRGINGHKHKDPRIWPMCTYHSHGEKVCSFEGDPERLRYAGKGPTPKDK